MNKKSNRNYVKLIVFALFVVLLATSANSAVINGNKNIQNNPPPSNPLMMEEYYEWIDDFDDAQKVDMTQSWGYEISGGKAKMANTHSVWDDPDWTRMKPVTVSNSGGSQDDAAVNFEVAYDSDMQSDYDDIRFKHEDASNNFLPYWIEDYDSSSVSVWVKIPTLKAGTNDMYLFYGNSGASDQSSFGDTFTDWEQQWANDEQISYHANSEGAWDPDVSYGSGKFLVAWEEGQAYWPAAGSLGFKQEIRCSIYVPGDDDPVVFDKRIFKDSKTYYRNENPSIAYNGDDTWLVAWEHYEPTNTPLNPPSPTTMDIYGRTVKKSGSDISLGTTYEICDASNCQADAKVVYDSVGDQFAVFWEDARSGMSDYDIYARFVDADTGQPSGSDITICDDANSQCEPWAAYDPINEQYFVVWEEGQDPEDGPFRIMGGIYDDDLGDISTFTVAQPSDPNNVDYNFPCVSFDEESERYLVTWNDGDLSDGDWYGNIYGKIYDSSGSVEVDEFTIRSGNFIRTDIVPYLSEAFLVSFDNGAKIYGRLVSSEGDLYGGDIEISGYQNCDGDWANLATDGSNIFVVWEDLRIEYPYPYDDVYPDAFGNCINLNIPDSSQITITYGDEKELILTAQITSKKIEASNLESWHDFWVEFDNTITFDIMNENGNVILIEDISSGQSLAGINPVLHKKIRCRAHFSRTDPSYTPWIDWWKVRYVGRDDEPPVTTIDEIDGVQGLNGWYTSPGVIVYLKAEDFPPDTGSGVNTTYYTLDGGAPLIYNDGSGIQLTTYEPDWLGIWEINFWSVDKKGNVEEKDKPQNKITIKIDAERPYVEIYEPANEQEVEVPFWVRAYASDNAEIDRVEFDAEPFGDPWVDKTPPWEWHCEDDISRARARAAGGWNPYPTGVNVMVRAQVFDASGQDWIHEVWVNVINPITGPIFNMLSVFLERFKLAIALGGSLDLEIPEPENADSVKFDATKILTRKQTTLWDNDFSDGVSANFDIPSGFYKITTTSYKEGVEISSELISRVFFIDK